MKRLTETRGKWIVLLFVTLVLAVGLSPFASSHPDGLERVAEDQGFLEKGKAGFFYSPVPDYEIAGISSNWLKVGLSGLVGVGLMLLVLGGVAALFRRGGARAGKDIH